MHATDVAVVRTMTQLIKVGDVRTRPETTGLNGEAGTSRKRAAAHLEARTFDFYYGLFRALERVDMVADRHHITAIIGPSGCGKSTLLRAFNRMHERNADIHTAGELLLADVDISQFGDLVELRRRVGMVFQRPNPFPMSIFDNVAYGLRLSVHRVRRQEISERVEQALRDAALWDEVRDKLNHSAFTLSGGQQQRLCIARTLAVQPEVILLDEPTSALDPNATLRIEELLQDIKSRYTILIVTHNLQQAARISDRTICMLMNPETRAGFVVEEGQTEQLFRAPQDPRTEAYITGRFG
ncbi:MAG: phosphate ABC transporter ATP-binding protein PstB [Herpetosiphon sp.]